MISSCPCRQAFIVFIILPYGFFFYIFWVGAAVAQAHSPHFSIEKNRSRRSVRRPAVARPTTKPKAAGRVWRRASTGMPSRE
ncbi:hypothetical protein D3OALGA1CA_379 [Olavius algarvensis associated proteobacterium Delta 3]|nr:hypothetical protein D3OALGA1CA_379 [Olavius algarvensis associated proteobacterium Delta 3]